MDLFFYREPEETKEQEEEEAVPVADYALPPADYGLPAADWGAQIADGQWTAEAAPPPIAAVPAANFYPEQGIELFQHQFSSLNHFKFTFHEVVRCCF